MVSSRDWSELPPQQVKLDQLVTTKSTLDLEALLSEDSTFYGDLFPHVVRYDGVLYLEDGVHRALRSALHHRSVIHARILDLDDDSIS
nr:type II toxin-antitoxin system VapB family antitoxin [Glutamicibacter sp. FBE19]